MRPVAILAAALLLAAVPLAGCLDGADGPAPGDDGDDGDGADGAEPQAETPQWSLGDTWTYDARTADIPKEETEMIVYDDDGQNYRVGATDRDQALIHGVTNVNPQLGRIQKGNLAVYEDGEPRAMYDFPLTDGKTWPTEIFVKTHGGTLTAEATYQEAIDTGVGTYPGFDIVATNDEGFTVHYDYVPEIQWFSTLVVRDADGTLLHELDLTGYTANGTGTGWFVRGSPLLPDDPSQGYRAYTPEDCGAPDRCTTKVVVDGRNDPKDDGQYDVVGFNLLVDIPNPDDDKAEVRIADAHGTAHYERTILESQESETNFTTVRDFAPGEWSVEVQLHGDAQVQLKMAGGWEYSGTVG